MKFDPSYGAPAFLNLETSVIDKYRDGIRKLRESEKPQEQLAILQGMFKCLEESHSGSDGIGWARDRMLMYQNLGKILGKISVLAFTPLQEIISKYTGLQEIFSKYSDLLHNYGLLDAECIENALEELKDIRGLLGEYGVDRGERLISDLDARLKREKEVDSLEHL